MQVRDFLLLVRFLLLDLELDLVENWYQLLVVLLNDLLIGPHPVQHVEVIILVNQRLRMQSVIKLSRRHILRENHLISQPFLHIVAVVPVILALKRHDLLDTFVRG